MERSGKEVIGIQLDNLIDPEQMQDLGGFGTTYQFGL